MMGGPISCRYHERNDFFGFPVFNAGHPDALYSEWLFFENLSKKPLFACVLCFPFFLFQSIIRVVCFFFGFVEKTFPASLGVLGAALKELSPHFEVLETHSFVEYLIA